MLWQIMVDGLKLVLQLNNQVGVGESLSLFLYRIGSINFA